MYVNGIWDSTSVAYYFDRLSMFCEEYVSNYDPYRVSGSVRHRCCADAGCARRVAVGGEVSARPEYSQLVITEQPSDPLLNAHDKIERDRQITVVTEDIFCPPYRQLLIAIDLRYRI